MEQYQAIQARFLSALAHDRLSHAYLWYGETGVPLINVAMWFSKTIFCMHKQESGACHICSHCKRFDEGDMQDFYHIQPDGATIKVDQLRQLKSQLALRSMEQSQVVVVIEDVDKMSIGAMNSLLKLLEEPDQSIYFFLLTYKKEKVLPTILSRCQLVNFYHEKRELLSEQLQQFGVGPSLSVMLSLLTRDVELAKTLGQDESFQKFFQTIQLLMKALIVQDKQAFVITTTQLGDYVTDRSYAQMGLEMLLIYFRDVLMSQKQQPIYFDHLKTAYAKGKISPKALAAIVDAKIKLEANVSAQNCYDDLCVRLLQLEGTENG